GDGVDRAGWFRPGRLGGDGLAVVERFDLQPHTLDPGDTRLAGAAAMVGVGAVIPPNVVAGISRPRARLARLASRNRIRHQSREPVWRRDDATGGRGNFAGATGGDRASVPSRLHAVPRPVRRRD